ncbi:type II toxin-antitoxin system VapC family toxin [Methylomonas sp. CM2]|uniref:type II toxin-antitoxin system VapC family toxin n=1 Tax=Methylomonas sp. CM2 TaxID=3417647 RepID=UPI003CF61362
MILVDTSVWVDHFKNRNEDLVRLLVSDSALIHPLIVAELACGTPPAPRTQTLNNLRQLRYCNQAGLQEVEDFIEREALYGLGCGLIDLQLLASVLITPGAKLWTLDKQLAKLAERFGVAYQASPTTN